jgi:hypothetical protein
MRQPAVALTLGVMAAGFEGIDAPEGTPGANGRTMDDGASPRDVRSSLPWPLEEHGAGGAVLATYGPAA